MNSEIVIRHALPEDAAYILATWLRFYKGNSPFTKRIRHKVYYRWHPRIIEAVLSRPATKAFIAHPTGESEVIFGYLVTEWRGERPLVHFVFVKEELRRMGIGRALLEASRVDLSQAIFTHWTYDVDQILPKFPGLTYDPYNV